MKNTTKTPSIWSITALERITGKKPAPMDRTEMGELATPDLSSPRSIIIEKDRTISDVDSAKSFQNVVDAIARATSIKRNEVENALIVTGSSKGVRRMSRKALNKQIQDRLVQDDANGEKFRMYMAELVAKLYGTQIMSDGFYRTDTTTRTPQESSVGGSADLDNPFMYSNTNYDLPTSDFTTYSSSQVLTNIEETNDGGAVETKPQTDWGGILSGSASVINSIGNVIGLFVGGNNTSQTGGVSIFDGSGGELTERERELQKEQEAKVRRRNLLMIIGGLVIVGVVIGVIVYTRKNKNPNKK